MLPRFPRPGGGSLQQVAEPNRPQPESRAVGAASRSAVWGASRGAARPRHVDTALQCPPSRPGLASRRGRLSATLKTEPAVPGSTALWVWTSWPGGSQHPKRGFNGRVGVFWTCRKGHLGREQLRRRPRGREGLRRCGAHRGARGHPLSRPPLLRLHWPLLFPPTLGLFPRASSLHLHPAPGTPRPTPTPPLPSIHTRFSGLSPRPSPRTPDSSVQTPSPRRQLLLGVQRTSQTRASRAPRPSHGLLRTTVGA